RAEEHEAVRRSQAAFDGAFRMGHQADYVAFAIAHARNPGERTIRIRFAVGWFGGGAVGMHIAENYLLIALDIGKRGGVAKIIAFHVSDRKAQHLAGGGGAGEGGIRVLHADMNLATEETQARIARHCAGQQARFEQNLESIADAENQPARVRKSFHGFHDRRKARDGAGAEVVAIGEAAGQDDRIHAGDFLRLMPDELDWFAEYAADGVKRVMVAIGTRKNDDAELHSRAFS